MSRGVDVRQSLMTSAIKVVSIHGIQNATTKALATESKLNEVYIYRYFKSKDDLLEQTFRALDKELMFVLKQLLKDLDLSQGVGEASDPYSKNFGSLRLAIGINALLHTVLLLIYYMTYSETARKEMYQPLLDEVSSFFAEGSSPWAELNHIYDVVFAKLWRVIRGTLPATEQIMESVYREILPDIEEKVVLNNKAK